MLPNDNVSVSWKSRELWHRLGQGKSGRQRGTATDQIDKRGNLDQETPIWMNRVAGSYQLSHTWDQVPGHAFHRAVNSQDVIKMSDGHRNAVIR